MKNLGQITNLEVLRQFVSLAGKHVVDAGCGAMTFSKVLADEGARVLAIDPDPIQADKNRKAPVPGIEFFETGADQIPVADASLDGYFFSYSLHHVPASIYPQVFAEVDRVLRPGGFLYVIEPIDCPLNQVMKHFYDEDEMRSAAWQALHDLAVPQFESCETVTYHGISVYDSWDHYADYFSNKSFNTIYSEEDVRRPEVKEAFHRLGGPEHRFESPKNVMVLKGKLAS